MALSLFNGADHLRNKAIFRKQCLHFNTAQRAKYSLPPRTQDVRYDSLYVTVGRNIGTRLFNDVCHVTLIGPDVEEWFFHGEHVVDFAWVNNAYIRLPHYDHVEIRCRQRSR